MQIGRGGDRAPRTPLVDTISIQHIALAQLFTRHSSLVTAGGRSLWQPIQPAPLTLFLNKFNKFNTQRFKPSPSHYPTIWGFQFSVFTSGVILSQSIPPSFPTFLYFPTFLLILFFLPPYLPHHPFTPSFPLHLQTTPSTNYNKYIHSFLFSTFTTVFSQPIYHFLLFNSAKHPEQKFPTRRFTIVFKKKKKKNSLLLHQQSFYYKYKYDFQLNYSSTD